MTDGMIGPGVSDDSSTPLTAEEIAKNVQTLKSRMKGSRNKNGRGLRSDGPSLSRSPSRTTSSNVTSKLMRKWGDSPVTDKDMAELDYSSATPATEKLTNGHATPVSVDGLVSNDAMGTRSSNGAYEVADWDYRRPKEEDLPTEEEILARATGQIFLGNDKAVDGEIEEPSTGGWSRMLARLTGKKVLTQDDLRPVLVDMEKHLMSKNVAKDIAEKLCNGVGAALVGKKLGGLTSEFSEPLASVSSLTFSYRRQVRGADRTFRIPHPSPYTQNIHRSALGNPTEAIFPLFVCLSGYASRPLRPDLCRGERCRKVHQPLESVLLAPPEWSACSHRRLRHIQERCR